MGVLANPKPQECCRLNRRELGLLSFGLLALSAGQSLASARKLSDQRPRRYQKAGMALGGFDTLAYFTLGKAVRGSKDLAHNWDGATWLFSSQEHLHRFKADPEAYAPRFGGYCPYWLARAALVPGSPQAWAIEDGKLYLSYSKTYRRTWLKQADNILPKAAANWAQIVAL